MSPRVSLLLSAVLATGLGAVLASPALATTHVEQTAAQRAAAFAALPNWTGMWETEEAAALRTDGGIRTPKLAGKPPYNAVWEKKFGNAPLPAEFAATTKACEPHGFPGIMAIPLPDYVFELLVTPEETLLLLTDGGARHIYTDGRSHPETDDLWPTAMGDSIGHWEGATLVIDTIARKAGPVLPLTGVADLSDKAHFTERLRLIDPETMQDDMTIIDPLRFSRPWQISIRYKRVTDIDRMISVDCAENDRNPVVDGRFVITPP